jgi:tRNA-binding protein
MSLIHYGDFEKVDIRNGVIARAENFERASKASYKIWVDFGHKIGIKQTSAQITHHYKLQDLIGKHVLGCINLGPKNIAGFVSEFLLLGFHDEAGHVYLASTDLSVPLGQKMC